MAGNAHSEAEDGLRAGAVGPCSAGIQNVLDRTKHADKPGDEPVMDVDVQGQAPHAPGVLRVVEHHAFPVPLPAAAEFSVG